jgi:putative transposase
MRKVPPSAMVREEINRTLAEGVNGEDDLLSTLVRLGLSYLVQQALEQEQEDFLGRGRYERRRSDLRAEDGQREAPRLYRNGYEEGRLKTAEGEVGVRMPRLRGCADDPYRSKLMEFLGGNSEALERVVVEMYARGLSTRDVEECFRDEISGALMISRSAVSETTDRLWEDHREFCERDLSGVEAHTILSKGSSRRVSESFWSSYPHAIWKTRCLMSRGERVTCLSRSPLGYALRDGFTQTHL